MARTTPTRVRGIIPVSAGVDLTEYINSASVLNEAVCVPPGVYSDDLLATIETYLAAHFYEMSGQEAGVLLEKEVDDVREKYAQRNIGRMGANDLLVGLRLTFYGQQAMVFDYNGYLALVNQRVHSRIVKPKALWLGTRCPRPLG